MTDPLTAVIAGLSALFALGSMVVAIVATSQTRKYHPKPYIQVRGQGWAASYGGPGYYLDIGNVSGIDAHDLSLEVKSPGVKGWQFAGMKDQLDAHTRWELNFSLVKPHPPEVHWLIPPPNYDGMPPKYGHWKWRTSWRSSPNPLRRTTKVHRRWITRRQFERSAYTAVG